MISTDLGAATGHGKNNATVELEMPSEQLDIDSGYDEALRNLRDRLEVPSAPVSEAQQQEDYYKSVRTYMVVSWMVANAILAMAISEAYSQKSVGDNFYLKFILWAVAAVAFFRALGSGAFGVINIIEMIVEGRVKIGRGSASGGSGSGGSESGQKRWKMPGSWFGGVTEKIKDGVSSIGSKS